MKPSLPLGARGPPFNIPMPWQPHSPPQTTAWSVHTLRHNYATKSPFVTIGCPKCTPKSAHSFQRWPPQSNAPIPRMIPLTIPNGIRIHLAVLPQYTFWTDRHTQTDRWSRWMFYSNTAYTRYTDRDNALKIDHKAIMLCSSLGTLAFLHQRSGWYSDGITPKGDTECGRWNGNLWPVSWYISETVQDRTWMYDLSNGIIFTDLVWPIIIPNR